MLEWTGWILLLVAAHTRSNLKKGAISYSSKGAFQASKSTKLHLMFWLPKGPGNVLRAKTQGECSVRSIGRVLL